MKSQLSRWAPPILWAGVIFTISAIPTFPKVAILWWDFILKKSAHVVEYAIFYFLLIRALTNTPQKQLIPLKFNLKIGVVGLILGIIYALSDEYHQSFVVGRTAKLTDVGFDTLGMIISRQFMRRRLNKKSLFERSRSR